MSHISHTGIKLHNNNQTGEYGLPNLPPLHGTIFLGVVGGWGGWCYFSLTSLAESSQQCCFMLAHCEIDFAWLQADCIDSKRVFLVADSRNESEGFMASGNRGTWSKRLKQNQQWDKMRVALLLWLLVTLFFFPVSSITVHNTWCTMTTAELFLAHISRWQHVNVILPLLLSTQFILVT